MRSSSWCANYTPTIPATTVFSDSEVEVFLPVQMNESVQPKVSPFTNSRFRGTDLHSAAAI
eukprot:4087634-Pyramimonas_sp.AAC.1